MRFVKMVFFISLATFCGVVAFTDTAAAQTQAQPPKTPYAPGPKLGQEKTFRYRIGLVVTAKSRVCRGIKATMPVPID